MKPEEVRQVSRACRRIEGWFSDEAAQLFGLLDSAQAAADVARHLFEIGVHHGRSTVLLCHMAAATERVRVCDVFGAQADNVSRSGSGDRAIFERNISELAAGSRAVEVFEKRSDQLTPARSDLATASFISTAAISRKRLWETCASPPMSCTRPA